MSGCRIYNNESGTAVPVIEVYRVRLLRISYETDFFHFTGYIFTFTDKECIMYY